ncbi:MAG: lipase [Deltaproteobacteria bacterium]|nr:MAG: lipase [Deltaproteobacteria bacterium]
MDWLTIIGSVVALAVLAGIATGLHYAYWVKRLAVVHDYAERHDLEMSDGVPITLRRLAPPPTPREPPVLLVHGVAANHRNVDAEAGISLARYLHGLGRDVWLLTLRSGQPGLSARQLGFVNYRAMAEHDLPEAVAFVRDRTRAETVDYVGFSMGGILLYGALGRTIESAVLGRVAFIGSPARVAPPHAYLKKLSFLPRFVFRGVWLRFWARMSAFIVEKIRTPAHHHIYNPDNVRPGVAARALVNLIEDVPAPLSADFAGWALDDGIVRLNGEDVLEGLGAVTRPALFIAGAADQVARPAAVRAAFDAWGRDHEGQEAVEKRFLVLGRDEGCAHDYGHGDLAIGDRLEEELFGPLGHFLASKP